MSAPKAVVAASPTMIVNSWARLDGSDSEGAGLSYEWSVISDNEATCSLL